MKRTALALTLICALLLSAVVGALFVNLVKANPVPSDYDPINITLKFPSNTTYATNNLNLTFIVDHRFQVEAWYSIDGKANEAVYPTSEQPFTLSVIGARMFSANLSDLSDGSHYISIYVASDIDVANSAGVYFTIDTTSKTQSNIMSFEEAIEAANIGNFSGGITISYMWTVEPKGNFFVDESGVSGFLMWLAPNGTFYEAEYPTGTALSEIGHTIVESDLNPPDGYYLWDLSIGDGEEYWILANNGTIFLYNTPRGGGPTSPPPPIPQEIIYGIVVAVSVAIVSIGLLVYFKKRKR